MRPDEFPAWFRLKVKEMGGATEASRQLGIHRQTVYSILRRGWADRDVIEKLGIRLVVDLENNS